MGIKISELPQASQLTSDDIIPIVQSGDTKKISVGNVISNSHNSSTAGTYSSDYINNNFNKVNVQTSQTTSATDTYSCNYIDNKIKNEYNTSTTEGYSNNYINNKIEELNTYSTYSTAEQREGTWIDGKPLYRKVFTVDINVASTTKHISVQDLNIDKAVLVSINSYWNNGSLVVGNYSDSSNDKAKVFYDKDLREITFIYTYPDTTGRSAIITFEYTKTTD